MQVSELVNYFKDIAEKHKQILHSDNEAHFSRIDLEEMLNGMRSKIHTPCLVLMFPEGRLFNNADNIQEHGVATFMILDKVKQGDYDGEVAVLDAMKLIGMEIVSKMWKDRQSFTAPMKAFELNSVTFNKVGPTFDNLYGWMFEFGVKGPVNLTYDPAKWNA